MGIGARITGHQSPKHIISSCSVHISSVKSPPFFVNALKKIAVIIKSAHAVDLIDTVAG